MKKTFLMCLFLAASVLYATNSQANELTIQNNKNCQFAVTFLFESGGSISPGIGANGSITIDFNPDGEHVIAAIFYDATTGAPAFTIGLTDITPSYTPFGMGTVANCPAVVFCTWSQAPGDPTADAVLTIS